MRLDQRPQSFLPASFYPSSSHFSRAPPPYSSLSGVQESTSHPLSMPVLVSGTEPVSQNRFVGVEVNHNSRVYHEKAGCSSSSGGVAVVGVVNMDTSAVGRSSTFTTTQEVEVRGILKRYLDHVHFCITCMHYCICTCYIECDCCSKPHPKLRLLTVQ